MFRPILLYPRWCMLRMDIVPLCKVAYFASSFIYWMKAVWNFLSIKKIPGQLLSFPALILANVLICSYEMNHFLPANQNHWSNGKCEWHITK